MGVCGTGNNNGGMIGMVGDWWGMVGSGGEWWGGGHWEWWNSELVGTMGN